MNNKIIDKMIEDTLYSIFDNYDIAKKIYEMNKAKFQVYANEYLLQVTLSNTIVKVVFSLNEVDELSSVSSDEIKEFVKEAEEVTTFKEYILQNAILESKSTGFLDWTNVEEKYDEENLLENQSLENSEWNSVVDALSKIALFSMKKSENIFNDNDGTFDLKLLLAEMLKEVAATETDDMEALIEDFEPLIEEDGIRIEKDESLNIIGSVVIEENGKELSFKEEEEVDLLNNDFEEEEEVDLLNNDFEEEEEVDLLNNDFEEEEEVDLLNNDFEEEEDKETSDNNDFEEEVDLLNNDFEEEEDKETSDKNDSEKEEDKETSDKNEDDYISDEYDDYINDDYNNDESDDDISADYDKEKYYKIKDDDELQQVLRFRRIKNILMFIAMFACFALALLLLLV